MNNTGEIFLHTQVNSGIDIALQDSDGLEAQLNAVFSPMA